MSFSLIPNYSFGKITDISPAFIKELGVRFLMLDLDNTVAAYTEHAPSKDVVNWIGDMKAAGIELFIVSNSRRKWRVESFAKSLHLDFINYACKPSPKALVNTMASASVGCEQSALIGDQIFTDTLAANLAEIFSILVKPKRCSNPALTLRFALELPFRAACRNKK